MSSFEIKILRHINKYLLNTHIPHLKFSTEIGNKRQHSMIHIMSVCHVLMSKIKFTITQHFKYQFPYIGVLAPQRKYYSISCIAHCFKPRIITPVFTISQLSMDNFPSGETMS
jgi:hypothetical protein